MLLSPPGNSAACAAQSCARRRGGSAACAARSCALRQWEILGDFERLWEILGTVLCRFKPAAQYQTVLLTVKAAIFSPKPSQYFPTLLNTSQAAINRIARVCGATQSAIYHTARVCGAFMSVFQTFPAAAVRAAFPDLSAPSAGWTPSLPPDSTRAFHRC